MRMLLRGGVGLALVAVGYVLGVSGILDSPPAQAQQVEQDASGLNADTQDKIKAAYTALLAAREALAADGRYEPITDESTLNVWGILTGGVDAEDDLERGQGVDPETFAALYSDLAAGDVRSDLDRDAQGRMTYKNKVIRMYPIARLKQEFVNRRELGGADE